jgi:2-octaprenyl-6-methoxyphenol hydroxylase
MKNYDITVVGNGLISKLIVVALSNLSFKICRVSSKSVQNTQNQIYSIREDSYSYLRYLNLFQSNQFHDIDKMSLFFGDANEFVLENYIDSQKILRIIDKNALEKSLEKIIEKKKIDLHHFDDIEIISDNKIKVYEGNQFIDIHSKIFLVSDGKKSIVRKKLFKKNHEIKFNQKAVTATFYSKNVKPIAYQWFKKSGILALIPISKNEVSMVLSCSKKNHISNPGLYLNSFFKKELSSVCGEQDLKNILFNSFDLSYTKPIFFKDSFVFFGDSCQAIHPLAGQGLNLGIKDVSVFFELIKEKSSRNINFKKLMYDYRRNRIFERVFFHKLTYLIAFLNFENNLLFEKFSSSILKILIQSNYLKQKVINIANGG